MPELPGVSVGGCMMAFKSRRYLKEQIIRQEYRIKELEEKLCPCCSHEYKWISPSFVYNGFDVDAVPRYKCKVCGKETEDIA